MNTVAVQKNGSGFGQMDSTAYDGGEKPGVYFLFWKRRLVYVGRSRDPAKRIQKHRMNGRAFDYALTVPCEAGDVDWIERALISALNPPQNTLGVTSPRELPPEPPQVMNVIYRAPPEPPPPDPHEIIGLEAARRLARDRALLPDFMAARESGELQFFPKNPAFTGPGSRQVMLLADLREWMERRLRARIGHRK